MRPHVLRPPLLLLAAACGAQDTARIEFDPTMPVGTPARQEVARALDFIAVVTSDNSKVVAADFESHVLKVYVHNNTHVKAGDPIADLDTTELRHKLIQATGNRDRAVGARAKAIAMAENAARKANLELRLVRGDASTREAYRNAKADASAYGAEAMAADGEVKTAESQITEIKDQLARAHVTSPLDGTVTAVRAKEGEMAQKGAQLARVFDPTQLVLKFAVAHEHRDDVTAGLAVDIELDKGVHVKATVKSVTPDSDPNIDFNIAEAEFDQPPRADEVHVGTSAHVRIAADKGAAL